MNSFILLKYILHFVPISTTILNTNQDLNIIENKINLERRINNIEKILMF